MPKKTLPMFTEADHATIARALYEASRLHNSQFDREHQRNPEVGRKMKALLLSHFPDTARAVQDAERLQRALSSGYLPPPEGGTADSVRSFLGIRLRKRLRVDPAPTPRPFDLKPDLPF